MHEVIKKSIEKFDDEFDNAGEWYIDTTLRKHLKSFIINSHITLAEEKIKELGGEKRRVVCNCAYNDPCDHIEPFEAYNQCKQEEIDKWKQFISELKQL